MRTISKIGNGMIALIALTILSACGVEITSGKDSVGPGPNLMSQPGSVYGTWAGLPPLELPNVKVSAQIRIESNRVSSISTCEFNDGTKLSVTATSLSDITSNTIRIREKQSNTVSMGGKQCDASLDVGEMGYEVNENSMRLFMGGVSMTLHRVG